MFSAVWAFVVLESICIAKTDVVKNKSVKTIKAMVVGFMVTLLSKN